MTTDNNQALVYLTQDVFGDDDSVWTEIQPLDVWRYEGNTNFRSRKLYTSPISPALIPQIVETLEEVRFYPAGDIGSGFDVVADDAKRLVGLIDAAIAALKQIGGA